MKKNTHNRFPLPKALQDPDTSSLWEQGVVCGGMIAMDIFKEFPNFPEGVTYDPNRNQTHKEMFVSYCIWRFHKQSPDSFAKEEMNEFYQRNPDIYYSEVCERVNEGLKESSADLWDKKHLKNGKREIPVIKNEYPI